MPESFRHQEKHTGHPSIAERVRLLVRGANHRDHAISAGRVADAPKPIQRKTGVRDVNNNRRADSARSIERVLVGAWNAVKPEGQGKGIMKAVDRVLGAPPMPPEDAKKRIAAEKAVGWTAVALEAGAIAFFAARAIVRAKKEPPWLVPITERTWKSKNEHPNPLIRHIDRLLKDEPRINGDGVALRTVIGGQIGDILVAITAIEFQRFALRDLRVDMVDIVKHIAEVVVIAQLDEQFGAERYQMNFTPIDEENWPREIPSDSLRTDQIGSDTLRAVAGMDDLSAVAHLLSGVTKDAAATKKRQDLFRRMWQND